MGFLDWEGLQEFWIKIKNTFLPLSGGTMKGDINLGTDKGFTGTTASGNKFDIFRVLNSTRLQVGGTYPSLELKGKDDRPTYNGNDMALYSDIPSGGSGGSNSIPFTYFTCYSNERTVRELIDQLANEGLDTTDSINVIVTFSAMLSGTFLCDISHYYGDYYGCKFTDLTNLKTYYFEGESRSLSLYDNLSGESSGEASMPRIRLSNWEYTVPATRYFDEYDSEIWNGEIKFSICIQDGSVQEGDAIQICALRKTYGKYKLRRFGEKVITAEDIENLTKQPFLQFVVGNMEDIFRTDSGSPDKAKPKYIRIRRPIWGENIHGNWVEVNALFSNVVPVNIGLRFEDI